MKLDAPWCFTKSDYLGAPEVNYDDKTHGLQEGLRAYKTSTKDRNIL